MTHEFAPDRYDTMTYRRCGGSGLKLPLISLGFWQALGEPGMEEVCRQAAYAAFDGGITHFDLANNYGPPPGNSEKVVGEILKDMPRDELIVSTKAGFGMWSGPYGDGGSKKYLVCQPGPVAAAPWVGLCGHLLSSPVRSRDAVGGDAGCARLDRQAG